MTPSLQRIARNVFLRYARSKVKLVNRPKGIDKKVDRQNASTEYLFDKENTSKPARVDTRPSDVFNTTPNNTGVLSLVQSGKDLSRAIETQVPKDRGFSTVRNLSQYLIETQGGGDTKQVKKKK